MVEQKLWKIFRNAMFFLLKIINSIDSNITLILLKEKESHNIYKAPYGTDCFLSEYHIITTVKL